MCDDEIMNMGEYESFSLARSFALENIKNTLQRVTAQTDIISEIYIFYKNNAVAIGATGEKRELYKMFGMEYEKFCDFLDKNNGKFVSLDENDTFDGKKRTYHLHKIR